MARGFTPLIGLAVVMALALAAVFGSLSLADPAQAQAPTVENVKVTVNPADEDDYEGSVLKAGAKSGFTVDFKVEMDSSFLPGSEIVIKMPEFGTPGTDTEDYHVRMFIRDMMGGTELFQGTQARLIGDSNAVKWGDDGEVTITVPNFQAPGSGFDVRGLRGDDWVGIIFTSEAGITAPEDLKTAELGEDGEGATSKEVMWSVASVKSEMGYGVIVEATYEATPSTAGLVTMIPDKVDPGDNIRVELNFDAGAAITTGIDEITVELEDFGVPSSIPSSAVTVSVTATYDADGVCGGAADVDCAYVPMTGDSDSGPSNRTVTNTASDVSVDGEKIMISLRLQSDDFVDVIPKGAPVKIVIRQSAGITTPSEGGTYSKDNEKNLLVTIGSDTDQFIQAVTVIRTLGLDPDEGGRGEMVTATGKGFKNGTSLLVFLDEDMDNMLDAGEDTLCTAIVGGDDVGSCEFEVTNPPFGSGANQVSAVDGRSNYPAEGEADAFLLDPSISATPTEGSPGDAILVQLSDFAPGNVTRVRVARQDYCNDDTSMAAPYGTCDWNIGATGDVNFQIMVPDWAPTGKIDLKVDTDPTTGADQDASLLLTISGPSVTSTPSEVIANQRISLVGDGFNDGSMISEISIGGEVINRTRINGGSNVYVDNGGGWSASVNLPLSEATTSEGSRQLRVTDSMGRVGVSALTIKSRSVTITPDSGRVGTLAVVRGEGFPSRNDEGSSFNVEIVYDAGDGETTVSAQPNAGGEFETEIRIPTTADIPSTNTVRVSFNTNLANSLRGGPPVITTVTHNVPEGAIELSETSGSSGSMISISGEGFKAFVPVQSVHVGSIEVTPTPTPSTDSQGMLNFDILIPGLETGIQTIEVQVSGTTASKGFTVTPSGVGRGGIMDVAEGVEALGDNMVSVWNFNNDTKKWTFYDPALAEGNTLSHLITGETYLVRIMSTTQVILNNETRNLTCVGGNCWNQIVW